MNEILGIMPKGLELRVIRQLPIYPRDIWIHVRQRFGKNKQTKTGAFISYVRHNFTNWDDVWLKYNLDWYSKATLVNCPISYEELRSAVDQEIMWLLLNKYRNMLSNESREYMEHNVGLKRGQSCGLTS